MSSDYPTFHELGSPMRLVATLLDGFSLQNSLRSGFPLYAFTSVFKLQGIPLRTVAERDQGEVRGLEQNHSNRVM